MRMTYKMKMPVVGQIYNKKSINYKYRITALRYIVYGLNQEVEGRVIELVCEEKNMKNILGSRSYLLSDINKFWEEFKEIEDQPLTEENLQNLSEEELMNIIDEEIDKSREERRTVKENLTDDKLGVALDDLKKELNSDGGYFLSRKGYYLDFSSKTLAEKTHNLLTVLGDSNIPKKADCGTIYYTKAKGKCNNCSKNLDGKRIDFDGNSYCSWECKDLVVKKILEKFKEKPKSIWKPVQDRPKYSCEAIFRRELYGEPTKYYYFFAEYKNQGAGIFEIKGWYAIGSNADDHGKKLIDQRSGEYCELTDFMNHIESLEQRIKKLEEK